MPVIVVFGMPSSVGLELLMKLRTDLILEVASIKELKLSQSEVTVFFPPDRCEMDLGLELIVFVEGLFKRPDRTPEVRRRLAKVIRDCLAEFTSRTMRQCKLIEVFVKSFDSEKDGCASAP